MTVIEELAGAGELATTAALDPFDVRLARRAPGLLRAFNDAGVLVAADVHVALRLGRLGAETDESVLLAAALAVRAPRLGHVYADLATIQSTVTVDADRPIDLQSLPWPDPQTWLARLAASPLVTLASPPSAEPSSRSAGQAAPGARDSTELPSRSAGSASVVADAGPASAPGTARPLRLDGSWLYLDRYAGEELQVAADLMARAAAPAAHVDDSLLAQGLDRFFTGDGGEDQRVAAATAVRRRLAVVAGGPGTGKTTTVARILALLDDQAKAAGVRPPLVALAAPTGKAAARLEEAVHREAASLPVDSGIRARLLSTSASTLHRLLGSRPDSHSRFRHNRGNRLPHDVVIVDETSMVSLSLMARLVEAVRTEARLVLVGDPQQLASVEAGAVLGDVVGPAADGPGGFPVEGGLGASVVVLRQVHRFGGAIAELAEAVRQGDADAAVEVLRAGEGNVTWLPIDVAAPGALSQLAPVREAAVASGRDLITSALAGDGRAALDALGTFRLLCAHRRGPYGVAPWMTEVERWLAAGVAGFEARGSWYVGRPLLITENDYGLRLYNGDTGVVVAAPGPDTDRVVAVFERRNELLRFSPTRLAAVETVHAMTVHKSQGSQFATVAVFLPDPTSAILTRELLYTAATRAQETLILVGTEESVRLAVSRPIARASGLRRRLWG